MPQGNPRGYRGAELDAMSRFSMLPPEILTQLLEFQSPAQVLSRRRGVPQADLMGQLGAAMEDRMTAPEDMARLRLLEQLLTSGSAGGAMGGGVPRGGGMSLNQVLSGQFSGSGR